MIPPLKPLGFKTVSYQRWQFFCIHSVSDAETEPGVGNCIIFKLSLVILSVVARELQDELN